MDEAYSAMDSVFNEDILPDADDEDIPQTHESSEMVISLLDIARPAKPKGQLYDPLFVYSR
jgi:hypothetical protein